MKAEKIFVVIGVIALLAIVAFCIYIFALASSWKLNVQDDSPFFRTTEPMIVKNITLPIGTIITYEKRNFWQKHEQKKLLSEDDISQISFSDGITINWGGVPITSIVNFYNPQMKGFSLYPDFDKLNENKKTKFSDLWLSCNDALGISVKNSNDWSFDKENIIEIESCGVNSQSYYKEDEEKKKVLDDLYSELINVKSEN